MVKLVRAFAVLCLILCALAAAPAPLVAASNKTVYIVQLAGAPLTRSAAAVVSTEGRRKLDFASAGSLRAQESLRLQQEEALASMREALHRRVEPLARYSVAFHGLALEMTEKEAAAVAELPGVKRVQISARYHVASDAGPAWIGAPGLWNGTTTGGLPGTKGEGMIIGVIDTGIAPGHHSFADVGGDGYNHVNPRGSGNYVGWCSPSNPDFDPSLPCNDKLIGVWSFPDAGGNPRDDNGHGTHTAGTAAGNHRTITVPGTSLVRQISGVAPHANLISYDACDYYCESWVLLDAVEQAVTDGVDVINLSVASYEYSPWNDSLSLALLEARTAGIFAATALDYGEVGSPGNAPWVLATGATTHNRAFTSALAGVSGGVAPLPNLPGNSLTTAYGPAAIVQAGDYGNYDCSSPFEPGIFSGQIVVCGHDYYDDWQIFQKGQNVLAGGGGGLILADYYRYDPQPPPSNNALPWVHLSPEDSQTLWDWLSIGSGHTVRIAATAANVDPVYGDRIWSGSPSGPADLYYTPGLLKPDAAAPGQEILAAHIAVGGYGILSGTSMAAAHAAGAGALLLKLHPGWTPTEIQSALQTTAATTVKLLDGTPATPFNAGSGRLSLGDAARAGLVLPVTTAEFEAANPWDDGDPKTLNLPGLLDEHCIQSCGWTRTVKSTLSTTSTWNVTVEAPAGVMLSVIPSSFTLGPGGTQSLQITASGPTTLADWTFGRVVLTEAAAQAPVARLTVATFWVYHYNLTVLKGGTGSGLATSNPPGINCGSDCSELYPDGTYVTLTAAPAPGSVFVGWEGDCQGPDPVCTVTMYGPRTQTAHFNPPFPDRALTNQVPLKDSIKGPVYGGTWKYYSADLGSGNSELVVDLLDLSGDVSLLVRFGQKPDIDYDADCIDDYSPYGTYNRRCVISNPAAGRWWIGVNNQEENVTLRYTVRASWGSSNDRELANHSPVSDFLSSPAAGAAWKYYFVDLPAGSADLAVDLFQLSADADLYVRHGAKPDRTNNDCASTEGSTEPDRCMFTSPAAGRWWIGVNNFSTGTINYKVLAGWRSADLATDLYTIPPCRVLDTRVTAQPLLPGAPRIVPFAGQCGIPPTAKAVAVNVTVVGPTAAGSLTLYPGDEGVPLTSSLSFGTGQLRSNNALLKVSSDGNASLGAIASLVGSGQVHVVVDVTGYSQ